VFGSVSGELAVFVDRAMSVPGDDGKRRDRAALAALSRILFSEDPIGLALGSNVDEYEPEAFTILPRLSGCASAGDVRRVVHEEFVTWFGAATAGPPEKYDTIASRVWDEVAPGLTG
jgi:hypothetical protein